MDIRAIKPSRKKALFLAKKQLPEFVTDAVNLEGIRYTLPEVQTLLEGITVGGHKLSDEKITLNQARAWRFLFQSLENNTFKLSREFVCELHAIAAEEEALTWGRFRDGKVTIAGANHQPPAAKHLPTLWDTMCNEAHAIQAPYPQAIYVFLQMARIQFFYDVNKRMGRFVMNGLLLQQGLPAINLPASRQLEFNEKMLAFYASNDVTDMTALMLDCLDKNIIEIMAE